MLARTYSFLLVVAAWTSASFAGDLATVASPAYPANDIGVTDKTGAQLALDLTFLDGAAQPHTLGSLLAGELPTIITFNYSRCQTLCSVQLNALVSALQDFEWQVGKQFRILTVDFDPADDATRLAAMRDKYLAQLPAGSDQGGWQFVAGAPTTRSVAQLADELGFRYRFIENVNEWAHPAALMFVSPRGKLVRYIHGIDYKPGDLKESIYFAGVEEVATAKGFLSRCFHWDPTVLDKSRYGLWSLRAAAGLAIVLLVFFGVRAFRRGQGPRGVTYDAT